MRVLSDTRKAILIRFILLNFVTLIIALVYSKISEYLIEADPEGTLCAFKEVLHFYCPGCGGTRAVISLLNLDIISSLIYYPPIVLCTALILINDAFDIKAFIKNSKTAFNFKLYYLPLILIIVQFFVRNILLVFGIDLLCDIL